MLLKNGKTTKNQSKNENLTAKSQKRKEKSKRKRTKRVLQRTHLFFFRATFVEQLTTKMNTFLLFLQRYIKFSNYTQTDKDIVKIFRGKIHFISLLSDKN